MRTSYLLLALLTAAASLPAQDTTPPAVSYRYPQAGASVSTLTEIQVQFNEGVAGVEASDLLVSGAACTNVFVFGQDVYVFQFSQPATGTVQVAFAAGHAIQDLAVPPNAFGGAAWTYNLDTNIPSATVIISEFLAVNSGSGTNALRDEDGDNSDWIEIRNFGPTTVDLEGWYLTDSLGDLTQWRFPANVSIAANGYLIVFASNKDRTNAAGRLHTSFQLASEGEYLALVNPLGQIASEFRPTFPRQSRDVSYGRDQANPDILGYFLVPTPGAPNSTSGAGFAPDVQFSRSSGTFVSPFALTLTTTDPGAVIRYTTNDTAVATNSLLYTGPLPISSSVRVRARAFQTGLSAGPIRSENYVLLAPNIANFSSDVPIVILHSFGNVNISAGAGSPDTPATFTVIEPDPETGRTLLTNAPAFSTRSGINLRGSSSQGIPKRNLAVEYWDEANQDIEIETLGLPAESDWVLYPPNGFDHPLIHNPFIYEVSRQAGRYASRTRFVELFYKIDGGGVVSNDYFGLYVLTEKIKIDNNRVDIPNLAPEETNSPAVTGGYLLLINSGRVDSNERAFNVNAAGQSGGAQEVIYQDPEALDILRPERRPQEIYITNYLGQFAAVLASANFTNPVTGYAAYIDVESWIDHHILNVLARNVDAIRLSGYFHKDRENKLEFGPIWDFDRSMGTGKPSETDINYRSYNPREWLNQAAGDRGTDFFRYATHRWWGRLFEDVDFWQRYIDRWQELRQTVFMTNNLFAVIDDMVAEISEAQQRDQARWAPPGFNGANSTTPRSGTITANGYTHIFDGTYAGEIVFLKRWLTERMDFIDTNFLAAPTIFGVPGLVTNGYTFQLNPPTRPPGSIVYYTLDGSDPRLPAGGISPGALVYSAPITVTTNIRVFARAFNANHRNVLNVNCPNGGCPPVSTPWSGPAVGTFFTSVPPLRITEIMYHPVDPPAGNTNDQDNFEYLEVRNIGTTTLNLNRFRIRGGLDFDFSNEVLAAGEQAVIVRNLAAFRQRYGAGPRILGVYTNDNLANDSDHLVLEGGVREPILDFTYDDGWYPATDGHGFSLQIVNDGATTGSWGLKTSWRPSSVANGTPSAADPTPAGIATIYVNEALPHTDPLPADAIELYNPTASDVNLGGWFLSDDLDTPKKYRIPDGTSIPANGYLVFYQSNSFGTGPTGFALSSRGDEVYVFSADAVGNLTGWAHGHDFGPQADGVTFGRHITSLGEDRFVAQTTPTLGAANSGPKVGPVIISEINYHPPDFRGPHRPVDNDRDEYIELQNTSGAVVLLYDPLNTANTWRLRDAVEFTFPTGASVPAGGYVLVVSFDPTDSAQLAVFRQVNGVPMETPIYGPWSGKLDNSQDSIELVRPDLPVPPGTPDAGLVSYILVERVNYQDTLPWPTGLPDGLGAALGRVDLAAYGDDPANWRTAPKTPGAPLPAGGIPPVIVTQPISTSGVEGQSATFTLTATGSALGYIWTKNGNVFSAPSSPVLTLTGLKLSDAGTYACYVFNTAGSVQSSNATLTVRPLPRITLQPTNQIVRLRPDPNSAPSTNVTFRVAATTVEPPLSYQWRFNGVNIPGATSDSFTVIDVQLEDEGDYSCAVTDGVATVFSFNARLTPWIKPIIIQPPVNQSVANGSDFSASVEVSGHPLPMGYRWFRASTSLTGTTNDARSNFVTLNTTTHGFRLTNDTLTRVIVTNLMTNGVIVSTNYVTNFFIGTNFTLRIIINNDAETTQAGVNTTCIITVLPDRDLDGIPDGIEESLGMSTNNAADALEDLDLDGMNNRAEIMAGTNPTNAASYLKIEGSVNAGQASVRVGVVAGRTYTVQYTDQLASGMWFRLGDVIARTTDRVETFIDPTWTTNRFYRVVLPALP